LMQGYRHHDVNATVSTQLGTSFVPGRAAVRSRVRTLTASIGANRLLSGTTLAASSAESRRPRPRPAPLPPRPRRPHDQHRLLLAQPQGQPGEQLLGAGVNLRRHRGPGGRRAWPALR
jgi:hypothetical protein